MISISRRCAGTANPGRYKSFLALFLLFTVLLNFFPVGAHALEKITFSWQANRPEDYVLGYRLYYGPSSRFTRGGVPQAHFSYDYYIDFFNSERCVADGSGTNCEKLAVTDLRCENLFSERPTCTVYNLPGQTYYFAMTAYNADTESGYTQELKAPTSRQRWTTLQYVKAMAPVLKTRRN